ncbi:MAG: cobyrinate a,c-diamide synthase [Halobacteriota archaeon]
MKGLMVAGTQSGIGKTTITLAILKALKDAGYKVQSCKVGPDFIDPSHLEKITGAPCYNLDVFMMGEDGVRRELAKCDADYVVIEGAMGLYDGISSCAKIADVAHIPVVLVVDASASSESVAATALGFIKYLAFTPHTTMIAGVVANKVGSEKHAKSIRRALQAVNIPLLGIVRKDALGIPSRHLGLYMGGETTLSPETLRSVSNSLDMERIRILAAEVMTRRQRPNSHAVREATVGIAYDEAFCFYYRSNIDALEKRANLVFFSPIRDSMPDVDALYFGGGYPELYTRKLGANHSLLNDIKTKAAEEMPIYGECGGLMYLSRSLAPAEGPPIRLAGILPAEIRMTSRRQALGHAAVKAQSDCVIAREGEVLRGHEYHYSTASVDPDARFAFKMVKGDGINGYDGVMEHNVVGSYLHVHAYSMLREFHTFIELAADYSKL